jgi:putative PIN family toxin of toxin-antitoxin system
MNPPRIVLDTNVVVSSLMSKLGNPAKIYRMFFAGTATLVFSDGIIAEYKDVLYRPRLCIPADEADSIIAAIQQSGERVEPVTSVFQMVDEDDRIFYDTAKSAGAYLITGNAKHYPTEPFILTPAAFLAL